MPCSRSTTKRHGPAATIMILVDWRGQDPPDPPGSRNRGRRGRRASDASAMERRAMKHITHWIGGKPWTGSDPARRGDVYNPATGQVTGTVDFATAAEAGAAVDAAAAAFPAWR